MNPAVMQRPPPRPPSRPTHRPSPLDDPRNAAYAWARYKRLLRLVGAVTAVVIVLAMATLYFIDEAASIHAYIAMALGIGATMMLGGALMGLMFLSSGTGHDEAIVNPLDDQD